MQEENTYNIQNSEVPTMKFEGDNNTNLTDGKIVVVREPPLTRHLSECIYIFGEDNRKLSRLY